MDDHRVLSASRMAIPDAFTFVISEPGSHRTIYWKSTSAPIHPVKFANLEDICTINTSRGPTHTVASPFYAVVGPRAANSLPQTISTTNLTNQQFSSHTIHHFATRTQPPTDLTFFQPWITMLQSQSTLLQASPLACCAAWFARNDRNSSMIDYSRYLYIQGLQEVSEALRVPELVLEDDTLGACLALTVFEVSECPNRNRVAYDWHRRANLNLLQMRGAYRHREGVGHELFLAARLHGVSIIGTCCTSS
jgi:hypothetical protein